jgi:hypothetical protein
VDERLRAVARPKKVGGGPMIDKSRVPQTAKSWHRRVIKPLVNRLEEEATRQKKLAADLSEAKVALLRPPN